MKRSPSLNKQYVSLSVFLGTFVLSTVAWADSPQKPRALKSSFLAISDVFTEEPIFKNGKRVVNRLFEKGSITIEDNNVGTLCSKGCDIIVNDGKEIESKAHTDYSIAIVTDRPKNYHNGANEMNIDYIFKVDNSTFYKVSTTQNFYEKGETKLKTVTHGMLFKGNIVFP